MSIASLAFLHYAMTLGAIPSVLINLLAYPTIEFDMLDLYLVFEDALTLL